MSKEVKMGNIAIGSMSYGVEIGGGRKVPRLAAGISALATEELLTRTAVTFGAVEYSTRRDPSLQVVRELLELQNSDGVLLAADCAREIDGTRYENMVSMHQIFNGSGEPVQPEVFLVTRGE